MADAKITVRVLGPEGKPQAGVDVVAMQAGSKVTAATSNADGIAVLTGVTTGQAYDLQAVANGGLTPAVTVKTDSESVEARIILPAAPAGGGAGGAAGGAGGAAGGAVLPADPSFDRLRALATDPNFAPEPPVNIGEAEEIARLFMVGVYTRAGIPEAMRNLTTHTEALFSEGVNGNKITFQGLDAPPQNIQAKLNSIRDRMDIVADNQVRLLTFVRSSFNLGVEAGPANVEFPTLFRRVVELCADDLMGVDPETVKPGKATVVDPRQYESVVTFLRNLKRAIIRMVQNMSVTGTLGTQTIVSKWADIVADSLEVLQYVANNAVVSRDADDRYPWSVLAALAGKPRSEIKAHIVNARDGSGLLDNLVAIYAYMQANSLLDKEDDATLRDIFYVARPEFQNLTVPTLVKPKASLLRENWLPNWRVS